MKCITLIAFITIIMIHMLKVGIAIFLLLAVYAAKNKERAQCSIELGADVEHDCDSVFKR